MKAALFADKEEVDDDGEESAVCLSKCSRLWPNRVNHNSLHSQMVEVEEEVELVFIQLTMIVINGRLRGVGRTVDLGSNYA